MPNTKLLSQLRSLTTPGLQSFVQQQQQQRQQQQQEEEDLDNAFNNFFVSNIQPATDLFSLSSASPLFFEAPIPRLTLDIAALAEQEYSFSSPVFPTSSLADEGQMHCLADWPGFMEHVSESVPIHEQDLCLLQECGASMGEMYPWPPAQPTASSTPQTSTSDSLPQRRSDSVDAPSKLDAAAAAASTKQLSDSTGNRNRRAKRKAKTGELYATGTMKRLSQPKPYDKMVKKYRLKL